MAHDVFISYSTKDKAWADAVCSTLEANGIKCWIAPRDIPIGTEYPAAVAMAVRECRVVVLIYSADSNSSTFVHKEIEAVSSRKNSIIPFRIENVPPSDDLAILINTSQWLDADIKNPEKSVALLVPAVQKLLSSAPATAMDKVVVPKLPKLVYTYKRLRRLQFAAGTVVLLAGIGIGAYLYLTRIDSILIMPFRNTSGQKEVDQYLVEFPWQIVDALRKLPFSRYRPKPTRETLERWADGQKDPAQASKDLGVKKVLTGKFALQSGQLSFQAELEYPLEDSSSWTLTSAKGSAFEQPCLKDPDDRKLLVLRRAILEGILDNLSPKPNAEERQLVLKAPTESCQAYDLYLKARVQWNQRDKVGFRKAMDLYKQALTLDPKFALAYSGLADCYNLMADYSYVRPTDPNEGFPAAERNADLALKIDPTLSEAHISKAFVLYQYHWDWTNAEQEFQTAFVSDPNYATGVQWYAIQLAYLGQFEKAIGLMKRARGYDRTSPILSTNLGWLLHLDKRDDEAMEELQNVLKDYPKFEEAHRQLGDVYLVKMDYADALAQYTEAERLEKESNEDTHEGSIEYESLIARAQAFLGEKNAGMKSQALRAVSELQIRYAKEYIPASYIALIYIALGDKDNAFKWLDTSVKDRSDEMALLKVDPAYDPLRSDPRFDALMKPIHYPQ